LVVDHFQVMANANKYIDEARRIEQDVTNKRRVMIQKKIFLVDFERLSEEGVKARGAFKQIPKPKGFLLG